MTKTYKAVAFAMKPAYNSQLYPLHLCLSEGKCLHYRQLSACPVYIARHTVQCSVYHMEPLGELYTGQNVLYTGQDAFSPPSTTCHIKHFKRKMQHFLTMQSKIYF